MSQSKEERGKAEPGKAEPGKAQPDKARLKAKPVKVWETKSAEDTIAAGRELVRMLKPPMMLVLRGQLGAGKTALLKGIAVELGAADADEVTSPTFTLVHEYEGKLPESAVPIKLYHLDLYRVENERQLETVGVDELLTADSLVFIEWGEKFPAIEERSNGEIFVESTGGDSRKISLSLKS